MKYRYIYILLTGIVLTALGCKKDFLNTKIDTFYTPATVATNRATLFSFGNAFYTQLQSGYTALDNNLFAAASDEAQETLPTTNTLIYNQGLLSASSNPQNNLYKTYFDGIRAANFFLEYSANAHAILTLGRDTVVDATNYANDIQNVGWYRAEAHIARAYYYSELIKRWGGVPIVTSSLQNAPTEYIPRASYDSCVNYIVSEINNYKAGLNVNWRTNNSNNDGRFYLGVALAIEARTLLYAASPLHNPTNDVTRWQKAAAAANAVITTPGLSFALYTGGYGNYFIGNTMLGNAETIFAVRGAAGNTQETQEYPITTPGGNSGVTPSNNLVADYEYIGPPVATNIYANRDPRLAATVVTNNSTWNGRTIDESAGGTDDLAITNTSKTGYYLKKFLTDNVNLVQGGTAQHQWVLYRYAEILLDYAEAMNEAYGPDNANGYTMTARQALKLVRARASASLPLVTVADVAGFRAAVKHERRIELAFEDHRYWDLLRWKDAGTVLNLPITGVQVSKVSPGVFNYLTVNVATRSFNDPLNYYYPFSLTEIGNSKGTLTQNPGY